MMIFSFLYEVVKFAVAGIAIVMVAFYLARPYLDSSQKLQLLDLKKATSAQTLPLRLQAYERVVLLIDRINPSNMLPRLNVSAYTAAELQSLIVTEVRNEFQHNVTQQLYISSRAWTLVKRIKDDTLNLCNGAMKTLPADASGLDLGRAILAHLSKMEHDPYDMAVGMIRTDLEELF
ncbi:hypothetical protein HQ865_24145 [Mucilaginibacter mali]|uniref:Uncharacterized protein n=1 Tax=Mucilaginibacter mali TaxID=2740462 RepID=A0A7D4UFG3_9SPHI|nr:hypothetical protein [Mucilaginibacter mali]QKJ32719.1 hypothetical protein HQ865_24145 [Mucilaginibacter mali]